MRFFATAIPGIAPVLVQELSERLTVTPQGEPGFDGRNDVVSFEGRGNTVFGRLRSAEDVFVEVGRAPRGKTLNTLVRELWDEREVTRALSVYAANVKPLRPRMTFRVVARVLKEAQFRRTELRNALTDFVARRHARWNPTERGEIELWAIESRPDLFQLGLRVTLSTMRHRQGRTEERRAALRPTVAGAMVLLAGGPGGRLLDPFCGSGTILREAAELGWTPFGSDADPEAVRAARVNLGAGAEISLADARGLPHPDESIDAVVSNLPFGKEYAVPDASDPWFTAVLTELSRVATAAAPIVLLAPPRPEFDRAVRKSGFQLARRLPIRLLGFPTAISELRRDLERRASTRRRERQG